MYEIFENIPGINDAGADELAEFSAFLHLCRIDANAEYTLFFKLALEKYLELKGDFSIRDLSQVEAKARDLIKQAEARLNR